MAVEVMKEKNHLMIEGLHVIVSIKASMNKGLTEELTSAFPTITPIDRPKVKISEIIDPHWLAGFVEGEGSFMVSTLDSSTHVLGVQTQLRFRISQHNRDKILMKSLVDYLNCGNYQLYSNRDLGEFVVTGFSDIAEKIIPFFQKFTLKGVKGLDYADFCKAAELMKTKAHLTVFLPPRGGDGKPGPHRTPFRAGGALAEGLEQIRKIKAGMNRGRTI
jgi:hypothetical protein